MTRIGINARVLAKPKLTGIGRYTECLVRALADHAPEFEFLLFGVQTLPDSHRTRENITNTNEPTSAHSGPRAHVWEQVALPRILDDYDLSLFHTPGGNPPLRADTPLVTTIHDISPIVHPEWFSRKYALMYRVLTPLAVRASEHILTVSEFARDEIVDAYPSAGERISVAYNGIDSLASRKEATVEDLQDHDFFLFVGSNNPRKNIRRLLVAYRQYRRRTDTPVSLVLVGPSRDVFSSLDLPQVEGVETMGFVSDPELNWLYDEATALVFPSLYEGFGLPIVEAMNVATPVITSDRGAMAEVASEAALLADPLNPDSIAEQMTVVSTDWSVADRLSQAGKARADEFTWDRTAARTADLYRELI